MKIDAHHHFWKYQPKRDRWITEDMSLIRRDYMPEDLQILIKALGIDGCVAIQASQTEDENNFLLSLSERFSFIKGIVGWVDLLDDNIQERLEYYSLFHNFKGVRHVLQDEPTDFMLQSGFISGLSKLSTHYLTYDLLIKENQLPEACRLMRELPPMKIVIDHIAKPDIRNKSFDHWALYMDKLSSYDHLCVKLSGMTTEAHWLNWKTGDLKRYVDFCLEKFGPNRLMFGSDWPVCLLAGTYVKTYQSLLSMIRELSDHEQEQILGKTAVKFYNLD